jgi:hypothetical protein
VKLLRLLAPLVVLTVLAAGCTSTKKAAPSPSTAARSAWAQTLAEVAEDGTVSLATALKAFVLAIGPVPGVAAPDGPSAEIASGSIAVKWVLAHWAELTAAQQTAVRADLIGTDTTTAPSSPAHGAGDPSGTRVQLAGLRKGPSTGSDPDIDCLPADTGATAPFRKMLTEIDADLADGEHLGPALYARPGSPLKSAEFHYSLSVNEHQLYNPPHVVTLMYTFPCRDNREVRTGDVPGCTIHINPAALDPKYSDHDRRSVLTHEMMHCVLNAYLGSDYFYIPDWYGEGAPDWVSAVLGGGDFASAEHFRTYLDTSDRPLYQRAHDGIGFFGHLAETGTNVWRRIFPIGQALLPLAVARSKRQATPALIAKGNRAGWDAAAPSEAFLDSWGPGYVRGRYPGKPWNTGGPGLPAGYQPKIATGELTDADPVTLTAKPAGTAVALVNVRSEVVTVVPSGTARGRLATGLGHDMSLAEAAGTTFCAKPGGCACPTGSAAGAVTFTQLAGGPNYVGVTGGPEAGSVRLIGQSVDAFCKQPPPKSCLVGSWTATGADLTLSHVTEHGGGGIKMQIDAAGPFSVRLDPMAPLEFTSSAGIAGTLTYAGSVTGKLTMPPAGATSGPWTATSEQWNAVTATIRVTKPFSTTIGPLPLAELAGSAGAGGTGAGGAVDSKPFSAGTWTCSGNSLTLTQTGQIAGSWRFART